jgi:hypothetical protein
MGPLFYRENMSRMTGNMNGLAMHIANNRINECYTKMIDYYKYLSQRFIGVPIHLNG